MKKQAFTLAEVLITLAIIGVVAAISIPSVVANTQQKEFQTGLRKAVSVLNSAITMNMAIDGETPYENQNLYYYLGRHMSIMKSHALAPATKGLTYINAAFYTTDGMRFEFAENGVVNEANLTLHENPEFHLRGATWSYADPDPETGTITEVRVGPCSKKSNGWNACGYCGSYGLNNNVDNTVSTPCLLVVDVNGDRKPFPTNASCYQAGAACASQNDRKFGDATGTKLTDTFTIMITDKQAIPYGVAAQRAMYQAQKGK